MPELGETAGLMEALSSAFADTLFEFGSGNLIVRTRAAYTAGGASITVEGTDRWPDSGRFAVNGVVGYYASKTDFTLDGITDEDGNVGIPVALTSGMVVMDISRVNTQLDDLRATMVLTTAEGLDLDVLARNYGLYRPRGLGDEEFREFLQVAIFLEAQTIYGIEQVLDALLGAGNYDLYEDLEDDIHKVFVKITTLVTSTVAPRGRSYICGNEIAAGAGAIWTVDNPVRVVYGAWVDDPLRNGVNYAVSGLVTNTSVGDPGKLFSAALFVGEDAARGVRLDRGSGVIEHWKVRTYLSPSQLILGWRDFTDGTLSNASPDRFVAPWGTFEGWEVGHQLAITSTDPANAGTYTIAEVVNSGEIRLLAAAFNTESNVSWTLQPSFTTGATTAYIVRATFAGNVVTLPAVPPAGTTRIDYAHTPSMQVIPNQSVSGEDQFPFYLYDPTSVAQALLDLITAAGVIPSVEF